ncbi:endonuclease/exonuclease/phosphatase family protein [Streptomyces sp. NPDC060065]|uniref:endonuclease/exonuclease/phosphatase family protein n=1 Tax=Streptomyces sp. NPDC060065 TaxID=3347050 RepID=UPI00367470EA
MTIRIATFNAENLFRRPKVFGIEDEGKRNEVLDDFNELAALIAKDLYSDADKERIAELVKKHRAYEADPDRAGAIYVNQTKGAGAKLFTLGGTDADPVINIKAKGRSKWAGWAELVRSDVSWAAVRNTGRVIAEVNADILLTVEVEDRLTLARFNRQVLGDALGKEPYPYNMLIDGNDSRGIDIGILSRHPITSLRSHIFDPKPSDPPVFSRDCPEFEIELDGTPLWILGNHFKSQIRGEGAGRRLAQARRVKEIYEEALLRSAHVVVAGDLNDRPTSLPIKELLDAGLRDAMTHPSYTGAPGTHGTGTSAAQKLDYLMFSPQLWELVRGTGVERRGIWAPNTFEHFDTVTARPEQASDHAALYADLDL